MTTAPVFRSAEPRPSDPGPPRPRLPRAGTVLLEQVRATGHAVRGPALIVGALLALLTLWVALQGVTRDVDVSLNAWPTQLPGFMGMLLPMAVWARDERFGPGFFWTLPVDRRRHALAKVLAGWVWLMAGVALFVLWLFAVILLTGGRAIPETLRLAPVDLVVAGPLDPAALRTVRWTPGPLIWAVPFTAATACYLLASALALASRHPLRWVIGAALVFTLSSISTPAASAQLGVRWLADAPEDLVRLIIGGRYGLDALLTARLETLGAPVSLTTGERVRVWSAVPALADWGAATLLWTGVGLLALWAAASRHREQRRG